MSNARFDFEVLKGATPEQMREGNIKPAFKYVGTHLVVDTWMDGNFACKDRLVAGEHKTAPPLSITYSSSVTRESVKLEFIIYSLKDLDTCACDIGNAYLNAPFWKKMWTESGSESGSEKGYVFLFVRALYELKYSGVAWRSKLAETFIKLVTGILSLTLTFGWIN